MRAFCRLGIGTLAAASFASAEAQSPRIVRSTVNWDAVANASNVDSAIGDSANAVGLSRISKQVESLDRRARAARAQPERLIPLLQVNATTAKIVPHVSKAGVPVLLPLEVNRLARDLYASSRPFQRATKEYLEGLRLNEFRPERNGYVAEFSTPAGRGITVQASSAFVSIDGSDISADQSGETTYTQNEFMREAEFWRYGVSYKVSLNCEPITRKDDLCDGNTYLQSLVGRLKVVGGVPSP